MNNNTFEKPIYVGTAKTINEKGLVVSVCLDDIPKEHIRDYKGKKWVSLNVYPLREPTDKKTHSVKIDTYKPKNKSNGKTE